MLVKLIKHNLKFGKYTFLGMGALIILASILIKVVEATFIESMTLPLLLLLCLVPATILCIVLVFQNFSKSVFNSQGYLTLTLPVKKELIVLGQLISSLIWGIFILIATVIGISILMGFKDFVDLWNRLLNIESMIYLVFMFFSTITFGSYLLLSVFMGITVSNTSIAKVKVPKTIAGIVVFAFIMIEYYVEYLANIIFGEHYLYLISNNGKFSMLMGTKSSFNTDLNSIFSVDIVSLFCVLAFIAIAYYVTVRLLKKRVELK